MKERSSPLAGGHQYKIEKNLGVHFKKIDPEILAQNIIDGFTSPDLSAKKKSGILYNVWMDFINKLPLLGDPDSHDAVDWHVDVLNRMYASVDADDPLRQAFQITGNNRALKRFVKANPATRAKLAALDFYDVSVVD